MNRKVETKLSEHTRNNKELNKIKCIHVVLDTSEKKSGMSLKATKIQCGSGDK